MLGTLESSCRNIENYVTGVAQQGNDQQARMTLYQAFRETRSFRTRKSIAFVTVSHLALYNSVPEFLIVKGGVSM